jgi:23S rRNA (uracil1939-C5)-methyltransferase
MVSLHGRLLSESFPVFVKSPCLYPLRQNLQCRSLFRYRQDAIPTAKPANTERFQYKPRSSKNKTSFANHFRTAPFLPPFASWKDPLPLVDLRTCPQHSEKLRSLHQFLENLPVRVSEMDWRFAVISGDLLTLVIKSKELPSPDLLAHLKALKWSRFSLQGVLLNLNASCGNRVLDPKRFHLLWGTSQAAARDFLRSLQPAGVIDLYCGLGLTLREWTALGFPTLGVELSGESVQLAWKNAPNSAEILQGKCEERVPQLNEFLSELSPGPLALYCNPPRMGIADTVLDWILSTTRIEKIAYLSCSPATLGRDLKRLEQNYRIVALQAFDFFPNTRQVETLALLEKAK